MRLFSDKSCRENQNTRFMSIFFNIKSRGVGDDVENNVQRDRLQTHTQNL